MIGMCEQREEIHARQLLESAYREHTRLQNIIVKVLARETELKSEIRHLRSLLPQNEWEKLDPSRPSQRGN